MDDKGRITILALFIAVMAFIGVTLGLFGFYGEMAHKHGVFYGDTEENITKNVQDIKTRSSSFAKTQKSKTQGLETGTGNTYINAVTGGLGVIKGFFNIATMLIMIGPTMASILEMPSWVGIIIESTVIFTVTYLVIKFIFGRN